MVNSERYIGKALVTGATGFVGKHMVNELSIFGYDVLGTTKTEEKQSEKIFLCDTRDSYATEKLLSKRFDIAIHLAAQASVARSFGESEAEYTKDVNLNGTRVFLEGLRKLGVNHPKKVIIVASSDIFGKPDSLPVTESTPFNPLNPYSYSKAEEIKLVEDYRREFDLDYIDIVIPFNHTGPGQGPGFLPSDIAGRLADIQLGQNSNPVLLTGDLSAKRDFSDVRDIVRAYRLLSEKNIRGDNYLLSSDKSVPLEWVVETLVGMCTVQVSRELDERFKRPSDISDLYGNSLKIRRTINYAPSIPLQKTLWDLYEYTVLEKSKKLSPAKID